jgi:DNA-binding response OmpR family regulator
MAKQGKWRRGRGICCYSWVAVTTVLLVDDDAELVGLLGEYLGREGFRVIAAADGERGVAAALAEAPDVVVLDIMLPGMNGLDVLRRIRERSSVPVIMLTARGDDVDRIVGLELGADDYVPKPFNPRELVARMRAVLRRVRSEGGDRTALVVGDLEVLPAAREVRRGGERVELTGTEFSILEYLVRSAGTVVRKEAVFRDVLGRRAVSYDRSVDVHVSNLRRKLGPLPDGGERIKTVRGVGYQYVRQDS